MRMRRARYGSKQFLELRRHKGLREKGITEYRTDVRYASWRALLWGALRADEVVGRDLER